MRAIAAAIYEGAVVFLKREYQLLAVFVLVVFTLLGLFIICLAIGLEGTLASGERRWAALMSSCRSSPARL
jgi:Na+/H+-translocating membrane pyrophosphatase